MPLKPEHEREKLADCRDALSEAISNLERLAKHSPDRKDSLDPHISCLRQEHEWVKLALSAFDKGVVQPAGLWSSSSISRQ